MSRSRIRDVLQNYSFWLVDVSPNLKPPFFALLPVYQFSSISSPEVTLSEREIAQCNSLFPVKVIESGSVNTLTLVRGATVADGDFWRWIRQTIHGHSNIGKSFLLIQFMDVNFSWDQNGGMPVGNAMAQLALGLGGAATAVFTTVMNGLPGMNSDAWKAMTPVRSWLLEQCKATRYKSAGDFDATSSDVSLLELDLSMESFEEIALM